MIAARAAISVAIAIAIAALPLAAPRAQQDNDLDVLLDRLGVYLAAYEKRLGEIVADESYFQQAIGKDRGGARQVVGRKLESEVSFLRLPGNADWYGIRDVRVVDGRAVAGPGVTLSELLKDPGADFLQRATAIVEASSRHNLGGARTINMPTVPLEVLSLRNQARFIFKERGTEKIGRVSTTRLDFEEFDEPTLIGAAGGGAMWTRGRALVDAATGQLWRVDLAVGPVPPGENRRPELESSMGVVFALDSALQMLVPRELVEGFWIPGGRGEGRARYSNFRRFSTAARIVPD